MSVKRVNKPAETTKPPIRAARAGAKKADASLCVVAVGASAGGFDALVELLDRLPADSGLAFIILQHLSPSPKSLSAELFSRHTAMKVCAAEHGMLLEANCVYTTPADQDIRVKAGRLRLSSPVEAPGHRLPVDHLFQSLGQDQRERAIGIILSGTGSDGTLGLKDIVANGGIVLVQAPDTAQFDGMPQSAIATGLVGYVLPVAKMPGVLVGYARHSYVRAPALVAPQPNRGDEVAMILGQLQANHRQSFAGYKPAMIARRIERRMGLLNIPTLNEYARRVKRDAEEASALRKDLLIGVTEFFRDRPAWEAFDDEVLRPLVAATKAGEPIRAWVAGAATGEEAYTLAIIILARLKAARKRCGVQIFATDASLDSLNYARAGRYPLGIRSKVREALLKRYFEPLKDDQYYQVTAEVRESVIFGEHDLLADPPFSRLDIVTCRNVLIYIEPSVQARILMLCHFALRPGGHLFLGSAETLGKHEKLFKTIDRKWHIYQRIGTTPRDQIEWPAGAPRSLASPALSEPASEAARITLHGHAARSELIERFAPAAILVDGRGQILSSSGNVEPYLLPSGRAPITGVLSRLPKVLRGKFTAAIERVAVTQRSVSIKGSSSEQSSYSSLEVMPVRTSSGDSSGPRYLIAFKDPTLPHRNLQSASPNGQLQQQLRVTQEDLRSAVSQLKSSNEDLRASHEETMSINEELQSMNEELESSKEELQSVNEELNTVNTQLQTKVTELEVANTDLRNLLASNEVATICIDRSFRIKWFTPAAHRLFNLLPADIGRPLTDLSLTRIDSTLMENAHAVLQSHKPRSQEIQHNGFLLRRILPYRTDNGHIGGVVITFADITEAKRASDAEIDKKARVNMQLEDRVRERTEELGRLARELALAEVRERQSIARDLHDGLGQELNAASIKLDALRNSHESPAARLALDEIAHLLESVVREMRSLTAQLNPPVLEQLGLVPALEWLSEEMRKSYGLEISFEDDEAAKPLDSVAASILFRAVRELLINVARHANVHVAHVTTRRGGGQLTVSVEDRGDGFAPDSTTSDSVGLGLATLRERISHIGGSFHIESARNHGTTATIEVPLAEK